MKEIWRTVPETPNYEVSNFGRVWSKSRITQLEGSCGIYQRRHKGRMLKFDLVGGNKGEDKYHQVGLCKNNVVHHKYVHRLVWEVFCGPIPNNKEINHKDGNKINNCLSNLEAVTKKENCKHARDNGLTQIGMQGELCPTSKLKEWQVRKIKIRAYRGDNHREIAKQMNVAFQTVSKIATGAGWKHILPELNKKRYEKGKWDRFVNQQKTGDYIEVKTLAQINTIRAAANRNGVKMIQIGLKIIFQ